MGLNRIPKEDVQEFIAAMREHVIVQFIADCKSGELGLEEFIAHVFISGVMFKGLTNE